MGRRHLLCCRPPAQHLPAGAAAGSALQRPPQAGVVGVGGLAGWVRGRQLLPWPGLLRLLVLLLHYLLLLRFGRLS